MRVLHLIPALLIRTCDSRNLESRDRGLRFELHARSPASLTNAILKFNVTVFINYEDDDRHSLSFDGQIDYIIGTSLYVYTMVDQTVYFRQFDLNTKAVLISQCIRPEQMPPLSAFAEAMTTATVVNRQTTDTLTCNQLLQVTFMGKNYVRCFKPPKKGLLSFFRKSKLRKHQEDSVVSRDILPDFRVLKCPVIPYDYPAVQPIPDKDGECNCRGRLRPCLFVHGLNVKSDRDTEDVSKYWGDMQEHGACCSVAKYLHSRTVTRAWYDPELSRRFCNAASRLSTNPDPKHIEGMTIVAHSNGNLVVAYAQAMKFCHFGPTTKWIALAPPMHGSILTAAMAESCAVHPNGTYVDSFWGHTLTAIHQCPLEEGAIALMPIRSLRENDPVRLKYLDAEKVFMSKNPSVLCGISPSGLTTKLSPQYSLLAKFGQFGTLQNDGAVEFESCRAGYKESDFKDTWKNTKRYRASINHTDCKMANGNGYFSDDRQPRKWFTCQF